MEVDCPLSLIYFLDFIHENQTFIYYIQDLLLL